MRVLFAPDGLPDALTAAQVAGAMAEGWRRAAPADTLHLVPLGDGGPGLVDSVALRAGGDLVALEIDGAGGPVAVLVVDDLPARPGRTVVMEASQVLGGDAVGAGRSPAVVPSTAFGALLDAVLGLNPDRLVVGVGGVRAHDAGVGALAALALVGQSSRRRDERPAGDPPLGDPPLGDPLRSGGLALVGLSESDLDGWVEVVGCFAGIEIEVAVDTEDPLLGLHGASATLGLGTPLLAAPVAADTAQELERAFGHAVHQIGRVLGPGGVRAAAALPGAGAGGGLAFALALLGGRLRPGAELIAELGGLDRIAEQGDLLVTGGPSLDPHALHGSAVSVVAGLGLGRGVPVVVVAQEVALGRREWSAIGIAAAYAVAEDLDELDQAIADPYGSILRRVERVARTWSH